jgi:hypothetical protein
MTRLGEILTRLAAAHALSSGAVLVTNDGAFGMVEAPPTEAWSTDRAP